MNVPKFMGKMKENGDTQESLAIALGITRATLNNKIHNRNGSSFNQPEIAIIRAHYHLNAEEVEAIFFND